KASAISVYLADTTPLSSAMDFKLHLENDPRVTDVTYVSKDQAMARFRQLPALDPSVIDTLGTNPLPASLDVTVRDIRDLTAIYLRRKEIEVMKLVGATDWFVRWPFIVEGLIVGVVGAAVAVLIVGFGYRPAVINLQSVLIFIPLAFDPAYLRVVLAAMLVFGLLLGSVRSYLGVRRFLKQ